MANQTIKQKLDAIKNTCHIYNYDLSSIRTEEYIVGLDMLFNSEMWRDIMIRRNKLFRAVANGDKNAFNQLHAIDGKAAAMILNYLVNVSVERRKVETSRTILLRDYLDDFVRTDNQRKLYDEYSQRIDSAVFIADVLESVLMNAEKTLDELDPSTILQEFDGIKKSIAILRDFTSLHHRKENNELTSLFCDYAEDCEQWLRTKAVLYAKEYNEKYESLKAAGVLPDKKKTKRTTREWLTERMHDLFYQDGNTRNQVQESHKKARKLVDSLTDEEVEEAMPYLSDLSVEQDRIRMARDKISLLTMRLLQLKCAEKLALFFSADNSNNPPVKK